METLGIAFLFVVMLAAPCMIALRSSRPQEPETDPYGDGDCGTGGDQELDPHGAAASGAGGQAYGGPALVATTLPVERPLTLSELAQRAENDARIAQEMAHEAHYAALSAAAHAARLRADAAIEAARMAEQAIREAPLHFEGEYLVTQLSELHAKSGSRAA